jgi:hypothetical protein
VSKCPIAVIVDNTKGVGPCLDALAVDISTIIFNPDNTKCRGDKFNDIWEPGGRGGIAENPNR